MNRGRLVVVSHTDHYRAGGTLMGWGPTVREVDALAGLFSEVVHVAPVHAAVAPPSALGYSQANVRVAAVEPSGGDTLGAKLGVLARWPGYLRVLEREAPAASVVQVRCPANVALLALLWLAARRPAAKRWAKYAGNWHPTGREPATHRLQRFLLRRNIHRGWVTVNGRWPGQGDHVVSFLNPCLTGEELEEGSQAAGEKSLEGVLRALFVGELNRAKGARRALQVLARLRDLGVEVELDVAGDGPDRESCAAFVVANGLQGLVRLYGWLPRPALAPLYAKAHVLILPTTSSEGWPKVLSEAMAYGVVPLASDVSSIPGILAEAGCGRAVPATDTAAFVAAVESWVRDPQGWKAESARACRAAAAFTYERYLSAVEELLFTPRKPSWAVSRGIECDPAAAGSEDPT